MLNFIPWIDNQNPNVVADDSRLCALDKPINIKTIFVRVRF